MKHVLIIILILFYYSCEDAETSLETEVALLGIIASGIIDFETNAFEIDTMYTHYDILGITVTASYDSGSIKVKDIYNSVDPGDYIWSGKGITYAIDTINFVIGYDTTEVSGEFSLINGDMCIISISVNDSLKTGITEKICSLN